MTDNSSESNFSPVDHLILNIPDSWSSGEVANTLMEDPAVDKWEPVLPWQNTVLRRDKERLRMLLAGHLESFQEHREEDKFEQFKDEILPNVPQLFLSEQEAAQYDQLVDVYDFWRDFYLYMELSRDSAMSIEEIVKDIKTNLVTSGFGRETHLRDKIAALRFLIVQEAVNKVGAENLIFVDNDDWAVINREWYSRTPRHFSTEFVNRLCRGGLINLKKELDPQIRDFMADGFRLFIYTHEQNLQKPNEALIVRRYGREGAEVLKELLEYKEFAGSFFVGVNSSDPSLVRDNVNPEKRPNYYPDGPDVLAAWIDFYVMMRYFDERSNGEVVDLEQLKSSLMKELTERNILNANGGYTDKIYAVKKLIWDMAKESTQDGEGEGKLKKLLNKFKKLLPLFCCPSV